MKQTFFSFSFLLNVGFISALLLLLPSGQVFATDYIFSGTGNWTTGTWAPSYPGTNIAAGNTITIQGDCSVDANVTSDSPITIDAGGSLSQTTGNLTMNATLTNNGAMSSGIFRSLTINSGGAFIHDGTSATLNSLANHGAVTLNTGKTLTVGNYIHNGTLTPNGSMVSNGTLTVSSGQSLTISDTWLTNNGSITVSGTSTLIVDGNFSFGGFKSLTNNGAVTLNAGKMVTLNGGSYIHNGTLTPNGTVVNNGTVVVSSGQTLTVSDTWFTNNIGNISVSGTLVVDDNIPINSGRTLTNNGTVTVNAGKTLSVNGTFNNNSTFNHNGILNGTGTIGGSASFTNPSGSTVAPGSSPGCLTFGNGLTNDGIITIEVNGTTACSQFDRITVTGTATLGGTLDVTIGYSPTNGDVITFLDATSISGTFANEPTLPSGWSLVYDSPNAGEVSLQYSFLPVELVSFQAKKQSENAALLLWRTASEQNNEGFLIERLSADGGQLVPNSHREWMELGFMSGHGTTLEEQSYTYTDSRPLPGINYYRLKQMDFDGQFEYSNVKSIVFDTGMGIQVYPNPPKADGLLNVNLPTKPEGSATLRIFDTNGKMVHRETLTNQFNQASFGNLPAGVYAIEVTSGYEVWRERLVVQ